MGAVGSRPDEDGAIFLRDQNRFSVTNLTITGSRNRTLFRITPNSFPIDRYTAKRDSGDDSPVDYVQTPDSANTAAGSPPAFVLRLTNDDELNFAFTCTLRKLYPDPSNPSVPAHVHIAGLTFVSAPSPRQIESLVTHEFHADPNIHKNPNFHLIGDLSTAESSSSTTQIQWSWKWRPPKPSEDAGGGWFNACSFVEYDQRAHKLNTLANWSFWVQNTSRSQTSPQQWSPRLDTLSPPRLRVPSAQSIDSRLSIVSDFDAIDPAQTPTATSHSPILDAELENPLGLIPSIVTGGPLDKLDVSCVVGRPGEDLSATEDGPVFRATMKSLEAKTSNYRSRMKRVLKTAEAAETAHLACNEAVASFTEALRGASLSNANAVRPALEHYFEKIAQEILDYERQNTVDLRKLIIEPISRLYNFDIKQADSKRRDFEEESKDYYSYVGKYLGQRSESLKEKKRVESDTKYISKRRTFELKRFDYSSFMHDLHGGRKDQEVLSQLTRYANAQAKGYMATAKKVEEMLPQLEVLCQEVTQADKEFQMQRTEREEKRRALEINPRASVVDTPTTSQVQAASATISHPGPDQDRQKRNSLYGTSPPQIPGAGTPYPGETSGVPSRSTSNKFKGFRDLEDRDASTLSAAYRKEGLLWSLSRPGGHIDPKAPLKPAWHKFWIVLDQGRLSEYVNWKDKLDLHMEPIDLRMASVRESRSSERRFCFEVITPNYTRVYQAPSEDDMKSWINAINNALQSAFEQKDVAADYGVETGTHSNANRKDIAAILTGKSSSFSGHRLTYHQHNQTANQKFVSRHATTGDKPNYLRPDGIDTVSETLQKVREVDQGNRYCADCNSEAKVEWVSINLGIVLCIECSGIHRSLGTHVSKVRSLTLDHTAFTPDLVDILLLVGNRVSNMIWEARLDRNAKLQPDSSREQRLNFIQNKYGHRAFIEATPHAADETLLTSIKRNDIQGVLHALAYHANPNALDRSRQTHAVFLALAAADPAMPGAMTSSSSSRGNPTINLTPQAQLSNPQSPSSPSRTSTDTIRPMTPTSQPRKHFPIAELLLQNGADIPTQPAPIPLTAAALQYLEFKSEQRSGLRTYGATSPSGPPSGGHVVDFVPRQRAGEGLSPTPPGKSGNGVVRSTSGLGFVGGAKALGGNNNEGGIRR